METKDKLDEMLSIQSKFQKNFFDTGFMSDEDRVKFTKENILSLHRELGEVLNETPWKTHRAKTEDANISNIGEELIDCYKFLLNIFIIWGFTADNIHRLFINKSEIVQERFDNEKDKLS